MLVFGLPIANAILDSDGVALFTVALLLILPMQTLGSILGQELFGEQRETVDWGKAVFHSFVNTNTLGMVLGLIFVLAGIRLPECVMDGITDIGKIASPLCLLLIGAGFDLSDIRGHAKELILGVVSRLFVIPAVFFPLIIRDGFLFSEKFILLLVCCAPTATSIYTIVEDGGLDRKLAKEIIIISTLASLLSLCLLYTSRCV